MIPLTHVSTVFSGHGINALAVLDVPAEPLSAQGLDAMLSHGVGDMLYMQNHRELRLNPAQFHPGAQSIICCSMDYSQVLEAKDGEIRRARYAQGKDYHKVFRKRLTAAGKSLDPEHTFRVAVDSAPVLERTLAHRAGLGWIGKNGLLLIPGKGSYHFLGFVFTTAHVETLAAENAADRCGSCQRCLSQCPTQAISQNRTVISPRCISYLTIEHKGVIPAKYAVNFKGWWFGCDICQEVCPWNRFASEPQEKRFLGADREDDLLNLKEEAFADHFAGRPIKRISWSQFRRNLLVALFSLDRLAEAHRIIEDTPDKLVLAQARELGLVEID